MKIKEKYQGIYVSLIVTSFISVLFYFKGQKYSAVLQEKSDFDHSTDHSYDNK